MPGPDNLAWLTAQQHVDGSWGGQARPEGRIVTTIFAARSLQESGCDAEPALARALDFLADAAVAGGASIDGTPRSVLCCYTGMLARLMIRAGRLDVAEGLLGWIVAHQEVAYGGVIYRPAPHVWGDYLRVRYGGCLASTTCLLGVAAAASAAVWARRAGMRVEVEPLIAATRDLLTDRRVAFGRTGVIPLAGSTKADPTGTRWLAPACPLDYVVDLVELLQVAADVGVPAEAMADALALLETWRLPDGGWPMAGRRRLPFAYHPEPVSRHSSSGIMLSGSPRSVDDRQDSASRQEHP